MPLISILAFSVWLSVLPSAQESRSGKCKHSITLIIFLATSFPEEEEEEEEEEEVLPSRNKNGVTKPVAHMSPDSTCHPPEPTKKGKIELLPEYVLPSM